MISGRFLLFWAMTYFIPMFKYVYGSCLAANIKSSNFCFSNACGQNSKSNRQAHEHVISVCIETNLLILSFHEA